MGNCSYNNLYDFNDIYRLSTRLGDGAFAVVHKRCRRSDKNKKLLNPKELQSIKNEIQILKNISHPNIINLIHSFDNENTVYMVLELCNNNDLFNALVTSKHTRFTEQK
eukprot:350001_1